jgi:diguanylate cyclase (GGDEF)-like protein
MRGTKKYYLDDESPIIKALNSKSTVIDDMELHIGDKITPLEVSATPIFDNKGEIIYAIAAFQDITVRKQAEAELALKNTALQQAKDELAKSNRSLEEKVRERTKELSQTLEILEATQGKLVKTNQELQRLSRVDKLTQIANRYCFDEYLSQEWNRLELELQPLSLIICDVDYFKKYNDFYGHQGGDRCLQEVALSLLSVVRCVTHLVARYGGEEFAVIMPLTDTKGAIVVAEEIQRAIHQAQLPHACSDISEFITATTGGTPATR